MSSNTAYHANRYDYDVPQGPYDWVEFVYSPDKRVISVSLSEVRSNYHKRSLSTQKPSFLNSLTISYALFLMRVMTNPRLHLAFLAISLYFAFSLYGDRYPSNDRSRILDLWVAIASVATFAATGVCSIIVRQHTRRSRGYKT